MKWYNDLYVGENAKKRKNKIIMHMKRNKPQLGAYLITLPVNDRNSLEIYPSYVLTQKHYQKKDMFVVGIGLGREETLLVMQNIIIKKKKKTGQFLVKKMIEMNR